MDNSWICRLIWLEGKAPWAHAASADFDDRFYAVKFTEVLEDGTIRGELLTRSAFQGLLAAARDDDASSM